MVDGVRQPVVSWPGVVAVASITYTVGHGISPGTAVLVTHPQPNPPALAGNLVIGDGVEGITIPSCKVQSIQCEGGDRGFRYLMEIVDRRWKWRPPFSNIAGRWNVPDAANWFSRPAPDSGPIIGNRYKYIPWSVRDVNLLISFLLEAMGEAPGSYSINIPQPAILPEQNWDYSNPALSLQSLCDSLGVRVIYRLDTDSVLVCPPGIEFGQLLPPGSFLKQSPAVGIPPRPDGIVLIGSPVRYQQKLKLQPMALDWDGQLVPLDQVSYAPQIQAKQQTNLVEVSADSFDGVIFTVKINNTTITYTAGGGDNAASVATALAAQINANVFLKADGVTAATVGISGNFRVTGKADGSGFRISTFADGGTIEWELTTAGTPGGRGWKNSMPPIFPGVLATNRLTYQMAQDLATRSVFRYYQVMAVDPATGLAPLTVPFYGAITRKEQILLQGTKMDVTLPVDANWNVRDLANIPYSQNWYDGYSRERDPACYGSYWQDFRFNRNKSLLILKENNLNTGAGEQIYVPFEIVPERQLVIFAEPVIFKLADGIKAADIVLETSFQLLGNDNNQIVRTEAHLEMPPPHFGTPEATVRHDDVQLLVALRDELSFQIGPAKPQIGNLTINGEGDMSGATFTVRIQGVTLTYLAIVGDTTTTIGDQFLALINESNALAQLGITAYDGGDGVVTIEGNADGTAFAVAASTDSMSVPAPTWAITQLGNKKAVNPLRAVRIDTNLPEQQLRALYYLQLEALKYAVTGGESRVYAGIRRIWLDGFVQQVTWSITGEGMTTTASGNTEHAYDYIPSLPERNRLEYLRSPRDILTDPRAPNLGRPRP